MKRTLGFSPCPNDTFIFAALVNKWIDWRGHEFDFLIEDVEVLNQAALQRSLEVTKLSFHAYSHCYHDYILLRSGSALGQGCGPLLICTHGFDHDSLAKASVAIPGELTTANFLLDYYAKGCRKKVMVFDQIEEAVLQGQVDAGVIIHENRFTYASRGLEKIIDLGLHWENQTALPIPLGGIVGQRTLPRETLRELSAMILESLEFAYANPQKIMPYVRLHAQEMEESVMLKHIALYVNEHTLTLRESGTEAITHFLDKCGVDQKLPAIIEQDP